MEYIDGLFNIVKDYWLLAFITAIFATFLESFIPALPLIAIVIANSMILGLGIGLITSTIGSCTGTTILFLLASKFSDIKLLEKIRNNKIDTAISWVKEQGFSTLFIAYASPFIPGCLVTIASGISKKDLYTFVPAMVSGKMVMTDVYGTEWSNNFDCNVVSDGTGEKWTAGSFKYTGDKWTKS